MISKQGKKIRIGVLTPPSSAAGLVPLSNLLNILYFQSHAINLITGNECYKFFKNDVRINTLGIDHYTDKNNILRNVNFFYLQIRISIALIKIVRKCDVWIFFLGGEIMFFPMITAKLFRRKVILLLSGSVVHSHNNDNSALFWLKLLTTINFNLCYKIILYSKNLVKEWDLEKWDNKIEFAHEHIIDFQKFKTVEQYCERDNLVGFIGRLSGEKGIWNFILACDTILKDQQNIKFIIIGDGLLRKKIEQYIDQKKLDNFVKIEGWISHDELPYYFNKLKLLVIPSYTEALPNVMLESIACGTPVLATAVGVIPNILKDGETGFIMENNSPQSIAENVFRALKDPNLEKIAVNAKKMIESEFSFDITVKQWKKILDKI
jgi:glycosyltransferase involved in cell wall biosynthesis